MKIEKLKILNNSNFREVIGGSLWSFSYRVLTILLGYISTYLIANKYGAITSGRFNLSSTIISICVLLSLLGFPNSIIRFVGEYKNISLLYNILQKMLFLSLLIAFVFALTLYFLSDFISNTIFHDSRLEYFLLIMLINIPFDVTSAILIEFIRGQRLIKISETIRNSKSIFYLLALLILIIIIKFNDLSPVVANLIGSVLVFFVVCIYVIKKKNNKVNYNDNISKITYSKILNISLPMLLTSSLFLLMSLTDKLMLGFFKTSYDVGIYSISLKLASVTSMVLAAINTIVAPKFSELFWARKLKEFKELVRFSSKIIFFSSAPIFLFYCIFSKKILSIFGIDFVKGNTALIILSIGQFVNASAGAVGNFLDMTGQQRILKNIVLISATVNVVLNYILIPKYGFNGAAISTAIAMIMWNIIAVIYVKIKYNLYTGYMPFLK